VKWLLFLLCNFSLFALEITTEYDKTPEEELREIIGQMDSMETYLRLDRSDEIVQIKGKRILERLEKLVKDVEMQELRKQFNTLRQKQLAQIAGIVPPSSPEVNLPKNQVYKPSTGKIDYSKWAKLPPVNREQILQGYNSDIPLRWQQRIAAYYLSIAVEETKVRKK
jgi:hypothetical protein